MLILELLVNGLMECEGICLFFELSPYCFLNLMVVLQSSLRGCGWLGTTWPPRSELCSPVLRYGTRRGKGGKVF